MNAFTPIPHGPGRRRTPRPAFPYYKLATWCERSACFRDGKVAYPSECAARLAAVKRPGTYRVSLVTRDGRTDLAPFTIT